MQGAMRYLVVSAALLLTPAVAAVEPAKTEAEDVPDMTNCTCFSNCLCGMDAPKHPFMGRKGHPMMLCDIEFQGVHISHLSPLQCAENWDSDIFQAGLHETDFVHVVKPQLLPPWGMLENPPASLYPIEDDTVVLDIGSSYGLFGLMVAKMYPKVKVVMVEPVDWVWALTYDNAKRNGLADQVTALEKPVTKDGRGVTLFVPLMHFFVSNIYRIAHGDAGYHHEKVGEETFGAGWDAAMHKKKNETIAFKDLLAKHVGDKKVSYARIDCVGCEQEIMQDVLDLGMPFWMQCHYHKERVHGMAREWAWRPFLTGISEHDARRCLDIQAIGEERLFERAMSRGYPVEQALHGLELLGAGNRIEGMQALAKVRPYDKAAKHMPEGPLREQYKLLHRALYQVSGFLRACALEAGDGVPQDAKAALELFQDVVGMEELDALEANFTELFEQLPILADVPSGSHFHMGEILSKMGKPKQAMEHFEIAATMGHAVAAARIHPPAQREFVGTNGLVAGNKVRQLMTKVRAEALGIPPALSDLLLGAYTSKAYDDCMKEDQEASVGRFEKVFKHKGMDFSHMDASRFRSWLHSAMECWMKETADPVSEAVKGGKTKDEL